MKVCEGYVFTDVCLSTGVRSASSIQRGLHPGGSASRGSASREVCIQGEGVGPPSPSDTMGYGQRARGKHPTGMYSCRLYAHGLVRSSWVLELDGSSLFQDSELVL